MGQSVTVANASGEKVYVKVGSSVKVRQKTSLNVGGQASSTSEGDSEPGQVGVGVEVRNT